MKQQVQKALIVWLLLIAAEILHGVIRAIVLVPWVGEFRSDQLGVFSGSLIVVALAAATIRWIGCRSNWDLLRIGILWVVLTLAFEFSFGLLVLDLSWDEITASYRIERGGFMPLGLFIMLFAPFIASKLTSKLEPSS